MKKVLAVLLSLLLCITLVACNRTSSVQKHLEGVLTEQLASGVKYVRVYLFDKDKKEGRYTISVALQPPIGAEDCTSAIEEICDIVEQYFTEKGYALSELQISLSDTVDGEASNVIFTWETSDYQTGELMHLKNSRIYDDVPVSQIGSYVLPGGQLHETDLTDDSLELTVMRIVLEQVGDGEKITIVEYQGTTLFIKVDLTESDPAPLTYALVAESRAASITDALLEQEQLDTTWDAITLEFVDIGSITFTHADVQENEYGGRYFDIPVGYFE